MSGGDINIEKNGNEKTSRERVIFHMEGDAFFVGVEVAKNPKLKGLPVVTGEERGIAPYRISILK